MGNILYSFRRCPYAMRARLALRSSGITYEHREIVLRDKPAAMLKASPKGTVPVFITSAETIIDESLDVCFWALEQSDPQGWLSTDRALMRAIIAQNDGPFKHHLDRYKYASRYSDDAARGDVDLAHLATAFESIALLEARLELTPYLMGEQPSLADIATFPFVRQFANAGPDAWNGAPYPKTQAWLSAWLASDDFTAIITKHPIWAPPS